MMMTTSQQNRMIEETDMKARAGAFHDLSLEEAELLKAQMEAKCTYLQAEEMAQRWAAVQAASAARAEEMAQRWAAVQAASAARKAVEEGATVGENEAALRRDGWI